MSDFYSKYLDLINKEKSNYRGAGIFFFENYGADDFMLLLGVDNKYNGNNFSVFGGGRDKEDPDSLYTAVREVFEELFNVRPGNIDSVVQEMKLKMEQGLVLEKVHGKKLNEISYFAKIDVMNIFFNHLYYHEILWPFKSNHKWNEYIDNVPAFIKDRVLKPTQKAGDGMNEIKKIYLIKYSDLTVPLKRGQERIITIKDTKYKLRDNLNRYLKENVIIDSIRSIKNNIL
jgi:hypothetical protein